MSSENPLPENSSRTAAFIIVDGTQLIAINDPTITIGRKKDNHIVIQNPHVSRHHAQIRLADQHYILVDLNSTVGTSVNGERVEHAFLKPGDVISIGGTPLIFGVGPVETEDLESVVRRISDTGTGPTDATNIKDLDQYLDLFNTTDDK